MSYKSPIEIEFEDPMTSIIAHIQKNNEMKIMATINQYVSVDKEELIKALNYDRQQYIKGYADAKAEYQRPQGKWVDGYGGEYRCTNCSSHSERITPYCWCCGADMKGGAE